MLMSVKDFLQGSKLFALLSEPKIRAEQQRAFEMCKYGIFTCKQAQLGACARFHFGFGVK